MKIQAVKLTTQKMNSFKSNMEHKNIPHIPSTNDDCFETSEKNLMPKKKNFFDKMREFMGNNSLAEAKNTQKSIWAPSYDLTQEIQSAIKDYKHSKPELGILGRVDANVLLKESKEDSDNILLSGAFSTPMLDRYLSIDEVMVKDPKTAQGPFGSIAKRLDGPFLARDVEMYKNGNKTHMGFLTVLNYDRTGNFEGVTVFKNVTIKDTLADQDLKDEDREFLIAADEMLKFKLDSNQASKDEIYAQDYEVSTSLNRLKSLGLDPNGNFFLEDKNSRTYSRYLLNFSDDGTKEVLGYNNFASDNGENTKPSYMAKATFSL